MTGAGIAWGVSLGSMVAVALAGNLVVVWRFHRLRSKVDQAFGRFLIATDEFGSGFNAPMDRLNAYIDAFSARQQKAGRRWTQ